jgi:glycosyltransferase involved in cell wall biosynthesis
MRTRNKLKTILLVSPFVPHPPARGIELRITRLLKWMHHEGYRVVLVVPADSIDGGALAELAKVTFAIHWTRPALRTRIGMRFPRLRTLLWEPIKAITAVVKSAAPATSSAISQSAGERGNLLTAMNSQRHLGDAQIKAWFAPDKLVTLVSKLARRYRPHAIIAEYIFSTPVFASIPAGTLKIVDTIDVFSRKEDQVLAYGIADPLACSEEEERRILLKADVIVAIQSREACLLKDLVPEREIILAGMDLDVVDDPREEDVIPNSIVVVASDNPLNVHGFKAFLSECWPIIKSAHPKATLHVVGKVGEACRVEDPAIRYSGWIDDLDQIYREANVIINPTVAGTGLKIKSVQALAHGKPLVAWPNGVEGLTYVGKAPFLECHSWQEFAHAVVLLLKSDIERRVLAERALAYATREFGADKVYANLRACLENKGSSKWIGGRSASDIEEESHAVG